MEQSIENLYKLDGRVPVAKALPFGLQHVLAMFVSNIAPIMILAGAVGLDSSVSAVLIQNCMVIAGIGTLVQLYPVWRIGSRLPIVMGISFTFLSLAIAIAASQGMGTLIGAVIIGGLIEGTLGLFAKYWIKLIPPVVAATVVTAMPQSRHTEVRREDIEKVPGLDIIAESPESGVSIVMARGGREFFVTGHLEYAPDTLDKEYRRDLGKRDDVDLPKNYYYHDDPTEEPLVTWRAHANLFYSNWINYYVYQETPYNIDDIK